MDISATEHLNSMLAGKPAVRVRVQRHRTAYDCQWRRAAGDWTEVCWPKDEVFDEIVSLPASVTSSLIVEVKKMAAHKERVKSFPIMARVRSEIIKNCSDSITFQKTMSLSVQFTKGWSVQKTAGVSTTAGGTLTVSAEVPFLKAAGGTFNFSQTVSSSSQSSESYSHLETRSSSELISVKPQSAGEYYLIAYEETLEVPFSAEIVVDGPLATNESGFSMASDLLSEQERTLPFDGSLTISDASRGETSIRYLDWKVVCADTQGEHVARLSREFVVPESALDASFKSRFSEPSIQLRENGINLGSRRPTAAPDEIGPPPDGKLFETLYSIEEQRMDPGQCGFNDLGVPNAGIYKVDYGTWHEYLGGREVATYAGKQETFMRCNIP